MLTSSLNYLRMEPEAVNHAFDGDWTISFAVLFPVTDHHIGWRTIFGKGGNSHCLDSPCGPYIFKHCDTYAIHTYTATD